MSRTSQRKPGRLSVTPPRQNAWDAIPDLAVEIISPSNTTVADVRKLVESFQAGVRLVWIIFPEQKQVYVYDSPATVRILEHHDELDGGAVLPGFRLPLATLFGNGAEPLF